MIIDFVFSLTFNNLILLLFLSGAQAFTVQVAVKKAFPLILMVVLFMMGKFGGAAVQKTMGLKVPSPRTSSPASSF